MSHTAVVLVAVVMVVEMLLSQDNHIADTAPVSTPIRALVSSVDCFCVQLLVC